MFKDCREYENSRVNRKTTHNTYIHPDIQPSFDAPSMQSKQVKNMIRKDFVDVKIGGEERGV